MEGTVCRLASPRVFSGLPAVGSAVSKVKHTLRLPIPHFPRGHPPLRSSHPPFPRRAAPPGSTHPALPSRATPPGSTHRPFPEWSTRPGPPHRVSTTSGKATWVHPSAISKVVTSPWEDQGGGFQVFRPLKAGITCSWCRWPVWVASVVPAPRLQKETPFHARRLPPRERRRVVVVVFVVVHVAVAELDLVRLRPRPRPRPRPSGRVTWAWFRVASGWPS